MTYLTTNFKKSSHPVKKCKCDVINYYCHCDGEDKLLDKLKLINVKKLKLFDFYFATKYNHLNVLKWLNTQQVIYRHLIIPYSHLLYNSLTIAAQKGYLNILKWMFDIYPNGFNHHLYKDAMCHGHGHLDIVKWLVYIKIPTNCYITHEIKNIKIIEYFFEINKIHIIRNKKNLQQIQRMKILISGVF